MKDQDRRDLFARARDGATPNDDDRRRVRAALHRKLGVGAAAAVGVTATKAAAGMAPTAAVTSTVTTAVGGVSAAVVAKALVVVAVVAATSWAVLPKHAAPVPTASPVVASAGVSSSPVAGRVLPPAIPAAAPEPVVIAPEKPAASVAVLARTSPVNDRAARAEPPPSAPFVTPAPPPEPSAPQAAEDVALLADIQRALRDGDSTRVLALVREHERRFPASAWGPEREGARVLALCSQTQPEEAMRIGQRFLGDHPQSPLAARVHSTCRIAGASR